MALGLGAGTLARLRYGDVIGRAKQMGYPTTSTALVGPYRYPGLQSLLARVGGKVRGAAHTIRHPFQSYSRVWHNIPAAAHEIAQRGVPATALAAKGAKGARVDPKYLRTLAAKGKLGLLGIPAGLLGGWLLDKYLRGEA
jgi:hypothetical protein